MLATLLTGWPVGGWAIAGSQGLVVCGEAGTDSEAHAVQGGRQEAKIQFQAALCPFFNWVVCLSGVELYKFCLLYTSDAADEVY